jgi:hypothetical protein
MSVRTAIAGVSRSPSGKTEALTAARSVPVDNRERVLEKLEKLAARLKSSKGIWPPNQCSDVNTHLAGMFLREHLGLFLEALRRMD